MMKTKKKKNSYWCNSTLDYWLIKSHEVVGANNWTKTGPNHEAKTMFILKTQRI